MTKTKCKSGKDLSSYIGGKLIGGITAVCFVLVACPISMAQGFSSNSVIFGNTPQVSELLRFSGGGTQGVNVSPLLLKQYANVPFRATLDLDDVTSVLNANRTVGVWDPKSTTGHSVYFMPVDVHAVTEAQTWRLIRESLLSNGDDNSFVIMIGSDSPSTDSRKTADDIKNRWDELFKQYPTVRVLGIPNVVYLEPVVDDSMKMRKAVFQSHESDIRTFKEKLDGSKFSDADVTEFRDVIDGIFKEISDANANNDVITTLAAVWKTDIRKLFESNASGDSRVRTKNFLTQIELALAKGIRPYQCLVTVSTSRGDGAQIAYFKSLLGQSTETAFGISMETRIVERARWTFVAKRFKGTTFRETGRAENVTCPDNKSTFLVEITES